MAGTLYLALWRLVLRCSPVGVNVAGETTQKEESAEEEPEANKGCKAMVDTSKEAGGVLLCGCVRASP